MILKATKQTINKFPTISFSSKKDYLDYISQFNDGEEVLVEILSKRTLSQNRIFHLWIKCIASHIGESFEAVRMWMVCKHFGCEEKEIEGKLYNIPCSTSRLSKQEFTESLQSMYIWALEELNIALPNNDNIIKQLKQKEQ